MKQRRKQGRLRRLTAADRARRRAHQLRTGRPPSLPPKRRGMEHQRKFVRRTPSQESRRMRALFRLWRSWR